MQLVFDNILCKVWHYIPVIVNGQFMNNGDLIFFAGPRTTNSLHQLPNSKSVNTSANPIDSIDFLELVASSLISLHVIMEMLCRLRGIRP